MATGQGMAPTKNPLKFPSSTTTLELSSCSDKSRSEIMQQTSKKTPSNKAVNGRRAFGENGFEEGGGYMAVKRAKLDNQFNMSTRGLYGNNDNSEDTEIFKGISIYINGYTDPPEPVLRERFIRNGGTFHPYVSSKTTYVVATNLATTTKQRYGSKTITPNWITDSISAGTALDTRKYMLYNLNQEKNQMTLTQIMSTKTKKADIDTNDTEMHANVSDNGNPESSKTPQNEFKTPESSLADEEDFKERVSESEEEFFECSQEDIPNSTHQTDINSNSKIDEIPSNESDKTEQEIHSENSETNGINTSGIDGDSMKKCTTPPKKLDPPSNHVTSPNKSERVKTATDEGFLEDFFGRSRLHLISEQKKDMQILVGNLRKNMDSHKFPNLQKFESEFENCGSINELPFSAAEVVLMHVDLDCFFVSVGLLSRPHLRGKPVVVTHSSGKTQESKSDIACASYEARKFGVRNGMWVGEAKGLCPNLEVIPYDFDEYRRVSKLFFETVASVTLDIEACSVDEMIVDVTSVLRKVPGSTPDTLAAFLRKIIWNETKCPASVGIGSNRLLARLAVKLAKPDGIHHLKDADAPAYIQGLQVRDLPGVGWSNEGKLRELNVDTCGDLLRVPLRDLKSTFGEKTAEKMLNLCRGKDAAEIKVGLERPKSLSVDVNFGIRFTKDDEVTQFLMKICKELSSRAERIQAVSTHFTLKLLIRKKGAGDPIKQGGHGIVDSMTRSRTLMNPTRNWHEFFKTASALVRLMRVPPSEYRGVGVTLTDLQFDCDKTNKKSIQRTLTDMPISRAHKMLSIITQKKSKSAFSDNMSNKSDSDSPSLTPEDAIAEITPVEINDDAALPEVSDLTNRNNILAKINVNKCNEQQKGHAMSKDTTDVSKLPIDVAVLRQLPREIAEEQCQIYGISKEVLDEVRDDIDNSSTSTENGTNNGMNPVVEDFYENVETIDQSFLQALPENVRQDVLIQLQEAKGRRNVNVTNTAFDDQQPCSSRQALERSKKLELHNNNIMESMDIEDVGDSNKPGSLEEQTTPIISYSSKNRSTKIDPKKFWDMSFDYLALPPKPCYPPYLGKCVEVGEVRDLIRQGLQVAEPIEAEIDNLEKYFIELISNGWIEQTQVLLKFLHRQTVQLGEHSKWTPFLHKIIETTQECCIRLYHGELEVE